MGQTFGKKTKYIVVILCDYLRHNTTKNGIHNEVSMLTNYLDQFFFLFVLILVISDPLPPHLTFLFKVQHQIRLLPRV